eukprot:1440423-Amphidinium_carterae.1
MAAMMSQAQQQQQQLLQQVQAVVTGQMQHQQQTQQPQHAQQQQQQSAADAVRKRCGENNSWSVHCPTGYQLDEVASDGRCMYRSLAVLRHTTWEEEYAAVQLALRDPPNALQDAWQDIVSPEEEANRMTDPNPEIPLPESAWPGAQALLAWSVSCSLNISVHSTTGAVLQYQYGQDPHQMHHLAYNGSHYRPYKIKTQATASHPSLHTRQLASGQFRNKLLDTKMRKMEAIAARQDWAKAVEHNGLVDVDLPASTHTKDCANVWFANINSLAANWDAVWELAELDADIIAVAEHCLAESDVDATAMKLRGQAWTSHWRTGRVDSAGRTTGGVGILLRNGLEFVASTHPVLAEFEQLGRVLTGWVLSGGRPCFHLMVVYAIADPHTPCNVEFSQRMLQALSEWHCIHRGQRVCCLGDFNMTPGEDPKFASWTIGGQYVDVIEAFRTQAEPQATHVAGRCIDYAFISTALCQSVQRAQPDEVWRFPSHRALMCTIQLRDAQEMLPTGFHLRVPQKLPITA